MSRRGMYRTPLASKPEFDPLSALKARIPVGFSGTAQSDVTKLLNDLKQQQIQRLGLSVPQEDASIDGVDVEGVSDIITKVKTAMKDFKSFEIKTVRSLVNYNNQNVPGYEIRVLLRLVSENGKNSATPPTPQPSAIEQALQQMKNLTPEQIQSLAAEGAAILEKQTPAKQLSGENK